MTGEELVARRRIVDRVVLFDGSAVVVLDSGRGSGRLANLARIDPAGEVVWQVEPPGSDASDAWVGVQQDPDGAVVAQTWSCYRVQVDPETGAVLSSILTK